MEQILKKEEMDSIKALADTNIKISEAKTVLFKLQEKETEYLELREKKAMERIAKTIEESQKFIDEAKKNFQETTDLYNSASALASFITEVFGKLEGLIKDFDKRNELWEKDIGKQQDDIEDLRKSIRSQTILIENDKKSIKRQQQKIEDEKSLIESRQAQILSALKVLDKKNGTNN